MIMVLLLKNCYSELNETNKTTLVIVTHDKDLASRCDNILMLRAGRMCS